QASAPPDLHPFPTRRSSDLMVGHEPQIHDKDKFPGVGALRLIAERSGNQLIEAAGRISPDDVIDTQYGDRQFRLHLGVVLLQALDRKSTRLNSSHVAISYAV